jgi:hypothetical protein
LGRWLRALELQLLQLHPYLLVALLRPLRL